MILSSKGVQVILHEEGFGKTCYVPTDKSGPTIGYGLDLQHQMPDKVVKWFTDAVGIKNAQRLATGCGLRGDKARAWCKTVQDIAITQAQGCAIFAMYVWPKYEADCEKAFPGWSKLKVTARDGLADLIYNRGPSMGCECDARDWDRRREMREIRAEVAKPNPNYLNIASLCRNMQRLWVGPPEDDDGLLGRCLIRGELIEYDRYPAYIV